MSCSSYLIALTKFILGVGCLIQAIIKIIYMCNNNNYNNNYNTLDYILKKSSKQDNSFFCIGSSNILEKGKVINIIFIYLFLFIFPNLQRLPITQIHV